MTPPIPVGADRKRPSKSCLPCRTAKAKCTGLSEDYLHQLDDPSFEPNPIVPRPQCTRCFKTQAECTFAPSRRKGRPRRITKQQPTPSASPRSSPSPSRSGSERVPSSIDSPSQPSSIFSTSSSKQNVHSPCWSLPTPDPLPISLAQEPSLEYLAEAYLAEIYVWAPLLPPDPAKLHHYLAVSDPLLTSVVASLIDASLPAPHFPPAPGRRITLSTLQAAVLLSLRSYGVKDRTLAVEIVQWVSIELRRLGWNGHDMSRISREVESFEMEAFVGLGYLVWGLSIQLGVLTGNRDLLLANIQLPHDVTPQNMILHAFGLLRDATDFDALWAGSDEDRMSYTIDVMHRSDRIQKAAIEYLRQTTPAFDPSSPSTPESLTIAAARESAFLTASVAPAAVILILSSTSPLSPLIAPSLPCSLDSTSYPSGPARLAVHCAATKILDLVRTSPTKEGMSVACQPHSPYFGCCFLVTSRGLLLGAEAAHVEMSKPQLDPSMIPFDKAQLESDLDLCEAILRHQATKWPSAESLMTEVGLLRRTAGIA